ncbi:Uu.00g119970.m01.CDS01 [Anthostomella pinea]|uniref:Uu.00g119970.m01.CDS01 n=1 Tax=Anthostomella pinea TaxID=933095 RepID=A0AAI8YER9_9PEZI|nr:Uu.00g119970.m01.CDS01 [Anthostomella pinea]
MLTQTSVRNSTTQLQINVILSAWQLLVSFTGSALAERIGRRKLCLCSLGACTAFFYILGGMTKVYGASDSKSGSYGTVACIFLFLGAYSFGITPLTAMYAPEVLPYNIRGTGVAIQGLISKFCGLLVTLRFQTKGRTLEEIDAIFDGENHSDVPDLKDVNMAKAEIIIGQSAAGEGVETQSVAMDSKANKS